MSCLHAVIGCTAVNLKMGFRMPLTFIIFRTYYFLSRDRVQLDFNFINHLTDFKLHILSYPHLDLANIEM